MFRAIFENSRILAWAVPGHLSATGRTGAPVDSYFEKSGEDLYLFCGLRRPNAFVETCGENRFGSWFSKGTILVIR